MSAAATLPEPVRFFVSYSHMDREWLLKLQPLLKFRGSTQLAHIWHDNELKASDRMHDEIQSALYQMDVFLCLLSNHFLASDYIMEHELQIAIERAEENKTLIVPLLLTEMDERDIKALRLDDFQPLPTWGRSWRSYERGDGHTMDAHRPIRSGLLDAIEQVRKRREAVGPG